MKKHLFLLVSIAFFQGCTFQNKIAIVDGSNEEITIHDFVAGQWVTTSDLLRVKTRDIGYPHPFDHIEVPPQTCYRNGKPFFDDFISQQTVLEQEGDQFVAQDEYGKVSLHFTAKNNDTTLALIYIRPGIEDINLHLSKVSTAKTCDYEVTPGNGIENGVNVAFNMHYFKGKYKVKDIDNKRISDVEILADNSITGLAEFDAYALHPVGFYIRVELFKRQESYRTRKWKTETFRLISKEYGFDLSAIPKNRFSEEIETLYEFRRT